jgi:hypothetical protein
MSCSCVKELEVVAFDGDMKKVREYVHMLTGVNNGRSSAHFRDK